MFTVKAVENDAELIAARELMSLAFRGSVDADSIRTSQDYVKQEPAFQYAPYRICVLDGEVVAHVVAPSYSLRYGAVELTFGGIGGVCSHPDHRGKGYVAAVMRDTVDYMQARGDHLSLLNTGWANLYTRFGFQTLWSDGTVEIAAAEAVKLTSSLTARPALPADVPQMAALFERLMAQHVTMTRSQNLWDWRMARDVRELRRVVENDSGHIAGYLAGFYGNRQIELVADSDEAVAALLADAAHFLQDGGPEKLSILVTPDEPLLHRIRRMVSCEYTREFVPGANWMARIIDAEGFREAVLTEMARQTDINDLIFSIEPDSVTLGLHGHDSTHAAFDQATFLQLLFGILPPTVLPLHADAVQLLDRLFPRRDFVICPWDWF